jgi:hypothetical protein
MSEARENPFPSLAGSNPLFDLIDLKLHSGLEWHSGSLMPDGSDDFYHPSSVPPWYAQDAK